MLKNALVILFLLCTSFFYAHDYYFAFAEVEYIEHKGEIQATLVVSTHDFEALLREKKIINRDLSYCIDNQEVLKEIEMELLKGFAFQSGEESVQFNLDGFDIMLTGITNFYLSAKQIDVKDSFFVKFDLLMDELPEQQNKLTFIYRNIKRTYIFLPAIREQEIILTEK